MKKNDEGIKAVRDARRAISKKFDDVPERLIAHYIALQEKHRDRMIRTDPAQPFQD